jgi:hypothetical protein
MIKTFGELRKALKDQNATWMPSEKFKDSDPLQNPPTGGGGKPIPVDKNKILDLKSLLKDNTNNPFLIKRRIDSGFVKSLSADNR